MLFSVADYSVWEIFPWQLFALFYAIALILFVFPKSSRWWPLSSFSFMPKRGRWNGVVTFCFFSFIAVPHFLMTAYPLGAQKAALASGQYSTFEAIYDGPQPERKVAWETIPETRISFSGMQYDLPGSLSGSIMLIANIQDELTPGRRYRLSISENVILSIEDET